VIQAATASSTGFGACREWRASAALVTLANAQITAISTNPSTTMGHSAPTSTATNPRVSGPGRRISDAGRAAPRTPIIASTHPNRYAVTNMVLTSSWRRCHKHVGLD
jgi:hypothetical protein